MNNLHLVMSSVISDLLYKQTYHCNRTMYLASLYLYIAMYISTH